MGKHTWYKGFLSGWVLLGGILISLGLLAALAVIVFVGRPGATQASSEAVALTVIPAPTLTPRIVLPTAEEVATPTPAGAFSTDGQIHVGVYVQITGTGGDGLRLRSGPGTGSPLLFLGMDAEVFQVKDGPRDADGFTWWYLAAPYDAKRSGWAAANYLRVIEPPQS